MPSGTFFFAQYETRFQKGSARENFTWRVENGKLRLVGYFVASPLLPATAPFSPGGTDRSRRSLESPLFIPNLDKENINNWLRFG